MTQNLEHPDFLAQRVAELRSALRETYPLRRKAGETPSRSGKESQEETRSLSPLPAPPALGRGRGVGGVGFSLLAERTGCQYVPADDGRGVLTCPLWGRALRLSVPEFEFLTPDGEKALSTAAQATLLYYLHTADGAPLSGEWVSFADLPGGRFYNQAFQGYSGQALARRFGSDASAFERAALQLGGEPAAFGDRAFSFQALPRVPVLGVLWLGDEDFPGSCQLLFDAAATHYLPIDVLAILGGGLARRWAAA